MTSSTFDYDVTTFDYAVTNFDYNITNFDYAVAFFDYDVDKLLCHYTHWYDVTESVAMNYCYDVTPSFHYDVSNISSMPSPTLL